MPRHGLKLLAFLLSLGVPALAEPLKGSEIRTLFNGNTVSGVYTSGRTFSEYHAPDGRALGDSGFGINVDACWNTDGDHVCYHYGPYGKRRTYCFTVEKVGESIQLRVAENGRLNGLASIESGNPHNFDDGGKRWSCDDLLSRAPENHHFSFSSGSRPLAWTGLGAKPAMRGRRTP